MITRLYYFIRLYIRVGGWLAALILITGLAIILASFRLSSNDRLLASQGEITKAKVTDKRVAAGVTNGHQRFRTSSKFYISYQFTPKTQKQVIRNERDVNNNFYSNIQVGDTFDLVYLASDPSIHDLYENELSDKSSTTLVVGAAFGLFGLACCYWTWLVSRRAMRARDSVEEIIDSFVTRRSFWPPLINRMQYQLRRDGQVSFHQTFLRPIWAYGSLKRGDSTRIAMTSEGPYWAKDLFLS